jgi:PIN domain nuclease of toxin-antitoxin system
VIVLDSHVLIWVDNDERKLGRQARKTIERAWPRGEVAVAAISFWELALLQARGRIDLPAAADDWRASLLANGLIELPITGAIGVRAVELGGLPSDPVDRLVVATTLLHRGELMTAEEGLLGWRHTLVRHDARE